MTLTIEETELLTTNVTLLPYSQLLDYTLLTIRQQLEDKEMLAKAELKHRFRVSDEQINAALFKRFGKGKVQKVAKRHGSISLAEIEQLDYLQDGWITKGDVTLLYGEYGTGKTTLALWKAYNLAKGTNILDRDTPCTPSRSLIIATDSGPESLKKSFHDLGINPDEDPIFIPGHKDQMIHIWGYAPKQGHEAWICDIHGVIELEQYIKQHDIAYVAVDSAKSVSSAASISGHYTSNEAVKALIKGTPQRRCLRSPRLLH